MSDENFRRNVILEFFKKDGEEDGVTYYVIKDKHTCLFNNEVPITIIEIHEDGSARAGSDDREADVFYEHDWDLVSVHRTSRVV